MLAVASSAKEDELGPLLERAGVADLLRTRTSSDDAENSKPDPDIVVAALKRTGCEPARAIMVGDTPYDVAAAKRAGIEIVGVESGGWTPEALAGAVAVYRDPADVLRALRRVPVRPAAPGSDHGLTPLWHLGVRPWSDPALAPWGQTVV